MTIEEKIKKEKTAKVLKGVGVAAVVTLLVSVVIFCIAAAAANCDVLTNPDTSEIEVVEGELFSLVATDPNGTEYYVETATGVMYVTKNSNESGYTVMLDSLSGKPLLYKNWLDYRK